MLELLLLFSTITTGNLPTYEKRVDYCYESWDHLSEKSKIEMAIGCSTVNGERVYWPSKIKRIYDE